MQNKLKIIGGEWRSRIITFPDVPGLRPTPARVRETLFNWLQAHIIASRCLDLYAGSGALGFEAASRGAKKVTQVEYDSKACQQLKNNAQLLKAEQVSVVARDVLQFLQQTPEVYSVIFLDPPFTSNLSVLTCQLIETNGWLAEHGLCYVESPANATLEGMPSNWKQIKHKVAGDVGYSLYARESST